MADHGLARLIAEHQRKTRDSYRDIAERGGDALKKTMVGALATTDRPAMPKPEVLEALAHALGLPVEQVTLAAAESAGHAVPPEVHVYRERVPDSDEQVIMAGYERLSPDKRKALLALVKSMADDV
ncbi:hypothetical protein [Micromonospora sp. NPDC048839]|uniref:hypothetical protein n=1 Tax=Micromonospora sp. NPDC048839 TaxID=3155641 RepID=UPI003400898C